MSDEPDFEEMGRLGAQLLASTDQIAAILRPTMEALATFERECKGAGMSDDAAAGYTLMLAEAYGWPPVAAKGTQEAPE